MKEPFKYFPIAKNSEIVSLESPILQKIQKAYDKVVKSELNGHQINFEKQALSLHKTTMFFENGKTRTRYTLLLLEPTSEVDDPTTPSPHLAICFLLATEVGNGIKIRYFSPTEESICLCGQYEEDVHLN
jgi:hypothetical protein